VATAGKGGKVEVGADTIGELNDWTLDENVDLMEEAVFGDDHQSHTVGLKDTSGSASGYFDATDIDKIAPGTEAVITLYIDATVNFSASAKISNRSVNTNVDGQAEIDFDFEFQEEGTWTTS